MSAKIQNPCKTKKKECKKRKTSLPLPTLQIAFSKIVAKKRIFASLNPKRKCFQTLLNKTSINFSIAVIPLYKDEEIAIQHNNAMDNNLIAQTQKELTKIQRRVDKLKASVTTHKHFLERSSDECWDNPKADEKYEHYTNLIEIAEQREELLENIQESLTHIANCFSKLEKL